MKKQQLWIVAFAAVVVATMATVAVQAQAVRGGDTVSVTDTRIDGALFSAGNAVTIDSEVNGDVYCAGQTVTISGTVHGDVLCAAQTLTIKGQVDGNVRVAGQVVNLDAMVNGSATIGAQAVTQGAGSMVKRDMVVGANSVSLHGKIGRDVTLGAQNVTLSGAIGRNVVSQVESLKLTSGARIGGSLSYASNSDAIRADNVVIAGDVTKTEPVVADKQNTSPTAGMILGWYVYWFVALLVIAVAFAVVSPNMLRVTTDRAFPYPWWTLLAGFVAGAALPVVLLLLGLTVVGLPLAAVVLFVWLATLLMSGPVFSFYIGRLLTAKGDTHPVVTMLAGAGVVTLASFVPVLNIFVILAVLWFGSGMILMEVFRRMPHRRVKKQASSKN